MSLQVQRVKETSLLKAMSAKHRSIFAVLSQVMVKADCGFKQPSIQKSPRMLSIFF
jgi:hypothetical protein